MGGGGKKIHPLHFSDPNLSVHLRSLDPSKDLLTYGYGSVAWKERMENWRQKQEKMHKMRNDGGGKGWNNDKEEPDLPLYEKEGQPACNEDRGDRFDRRLRQATAAIGMGP
ncbi:unnamed protein product [Musa hybrid cultivar]